MPSPLIPLKRIISPPPTSLQAHPFAIPISRKKLRTNQIISHGHPPHNKKRLLPKEEPQPAYIRKNRSNAKPPSQLRRAEAKRLPKGQNPTEVPLCGSPGEGKYIRSIASSARVRTVRAGDLIYLPSPGLLASPSASSSASSAAPGSVHRGEQARCRRWGSPA